MTIQKIIGFSGRKGSGKDTLANFLSLNSVNLFGCNSSIFSFAQTMKLIAVNFFGLKHKQAFGSLEDKNSLTNYLWEDLPHYSEIKYKYINPPKGQMTAREFLQEFGTGIARKMNKSIHINACFNMISKENFPLNFITDARFENEIDSIKDAGGIVIRLTRSTDNDNHISENELDKCTSKFDIILNNQHMSKEEQEFELIKKLKQINWIKNDYNLSKV
ncbi:hypothetical protein EBU24_00105 [bacterium]|nr:hypothetical protein [bacterium]